MTEPAAPLDFPALPPALRESLAPEVLAYILALEAQVLSLRQQVELLTERLNQTSQNSSRPPSSDPPSAPARPAKAASKRKRGGQPGHPGHQRTLLDARKVSAIEVHWPSACPTCQAVLPAEAVDETDVLRQQVWELPPSSRRPSNTATRRCAVPVARRGCGRSDRRMYRPAASGRA